MGFREELLGTDPEKFGSILDDLYFGYQYERTHNELNAAEAFPILRELMHRKYQIIREVWSGHPEDGLGRSDRREFERGASLGLDLAAVAISLYASSEAPKTPDAA